MRNRLVYTASLVLAALLLYLALRGVDIEAIADALRTANYAWIPILVAVMLLSILVRAWRWQLLIEALPEIAGAQLVNAKTDADTPGLPGIKPIFYSVIIGYMVNFAAPRLGEVARAANLSAHSRLRFSSLLGTVVTERILDVIVLGIGLGSVFLLLTGRTAILGDLLIEPVTAQLDRVSLPVVFPIVVAIALAVFLLYRLLEKMPGNRRKTGVSSGEHSLKPRLAAAFKAFREGMATILRAPRKQRIVWSTVIMWFLYLLMAYIPFLMLNTAGIYNLSLLDGWIVMIFGTVGILVPLPGGTGSYHYITIQALVYLFAFSHEAAATYAVLCHAAQLVLHVSAGGLCVVLQGSKIPPLRTSTSSAPEEMQEL